MTKEERLEMIKTYNICQEEIEKFAEKFIKRLEILFEEEEVYCIKFENFRGVKRIDSVTLSGDEIKITRVYYYRGGKDECNLFIPVSVFVDDNIDEYVRDVAKKEIEEHEKRNRENLIGELRICESNLKCLKDRITHIKKDIKEHK